MEMKESKITGKEFSIKEIEILGIEREDINVHQWNNMSLKMKMKYIIHKISFGLFFTSSDC